MQKLFGHKSEIFIPPFNTFNNNTLRAMSQIGLKIISAGAHAENVLDQNRSVFNADGKVNNNKIKPAAYHLPATISYKDFVNGKGIKVPVEKIQSDVTKNIARFGYAVIVLHPQDLVKLDKNGNSVNVLDSNETKDLSRLIDLLVSKNIRITSFSKIAGIGPTPVFSSVLLPVEMSNTQPNMKCTSGWYITRYYTPVETDFKGSKKNIEVDGVMRNFSKSFVNTVKIEGWGKTMQGDYLGYYDGSYHSSAYPLNSQEGPLVIGDIATDPLLITSNSAVKIPSLPSPWNNRVFNATDVGPLSKENILMFILVLEKLPDEGTKNLRLHPINNTVCY